MPDRPAPPAAGSDGPRAGAASVGTDGRTATGGGADAMSGPGKLLAAGREARELTIDEVGDALNLSPQTVEWLETDNFEALPAAAFTQGYIRNYAKHVGLDADAVVQAYQKKAGKPAVAWVSPRTGAASITDLVQKHPGLLITAVVAAVVLLIIIVLAVVWPDDSDPVEENPASEAALIGAESAPDGTTNGVDSALVAGSGSRANGGSTPTTQLAGAQGETANGTASGLGTAPRAGADSTAGTRFDAPPSDFDRDAIDPNDPLAHLPVAKTYPVDSEQDSSSAQVAESAVTSPDPGSASGNYRLNISKRLTPTGNDELRVEVIEDCWIAVKTPDGDDLYGLLGRPGQTVELVGQGPFRVLLGYAPGAQLFLNNREIGLGPYTRNNVASLVIGQ